MINKIYWMQKYPTHIYMAAQAHRCGGHGEVNTLDLTDCRSVVGLN